MSLVDLFRLIAAVLLPWMLGSIWLYVLMGAVARRAGGWALVLGGGYLIGLSGTSMICHGSSKARTIKNSILACKELVSHKLNDQIVEYLSNSTVRGNGE